MIAETVTQAELEKMKKDAGLRYMPTPLTYWYRMACAGEGPHAYNWSDKPHRLVYDLCSEIERGALRDDQIDLSDIREADEAAFKRAKRTRLRLKEIVAQAIVDAGYNPATAQGIAHFAVTALSSAGRLVGDEDRNRYEDKIDSLEADLESAVEVAFKRGAVEWTRLNYPKQYAALSAERPVGEARHEELCHTLRHFAEVAIQEKFRGWERLSPALTDAADALSSAGRLAGEGLQWLRDLTDGELEVAWAHLPLEVKDRFRRALASKEARDDE